MANENNQLFKGLGAGSLEVPADLILTAQDQLTPRYILYRANGSLLYGVMTQAQRDAIVSPPEGLQIYNSTSHSPNFFNGTSWQASFSAGSSGGTTLYADLTPSTESTPNTITNIKSYTLPANTLVVGKSLRITTFGTAVDDGFVVNYTFINFGATTTASTAFSNAAVNQWSMQTVIGPFSTSSESYSSASVYNLNPTYNSGTASELLTAPVVINIQVNLAANVNPQSVTCSGLVVELF